MTSIPTHDLQAADTRVLICPDIGGAIARFTFRDTDILRRAPESAIAGKLVRQMGSYPLVPYSNRIGSGRLVAGKESFSLRPNFPPEPHAIHGFGWQREWRVGGRSATSLELLLAHAPDVDWPFACEARQLFTLAGDALTLALTVRNTDSRAMPAGLGFHPYFTLTPGMHLQTEWSSMWKMGDDKLPVARVPVPVDADFSQLRPVEGWKIDHCFSGWKRHALLDYPTHRVTLTASEPCSNIVVYAPNDGRGFIAMEPVSNTNNAFAMAAQGTPDTGMRTLAPGESFSVSMTIASASGRPARG
jgi:aldose 1-epimerase